jgi:hypothetical protein
MPGGSNAAFAQIVGHAPEALLGHSDKEQSDEAWQMDDRVLDNGRGEDRQETTPLPDGSIRTRHTRRIPLFGEGQEVRYVMGVVEETLTPAPDRPAHALESGETFHAVFDAMPGPVMISRIADVSFRRQSAVQHFYGVRLAAGGPALYQFYTDVQDRERVAQSCGTAAVWLQNARAAPMVRLLGQLRTRRLKFIEGM